VVQGYALGELVRLANLDYLNLIRQTCIERNIVVPLSYGLKCLYVRTGTDGARVQELFHKLPTFYNALQISFVARIGSLFSAQAGSGQPPLGLEIPPKIPNFVNFFPIN